MSLDAYEAAESAAWAKFEDARNAADTALALEELEAGRKYTATLDAASLKHRQALTAARNAYHDAERAALVELRKAGGK